MIWEILSKKILRVAPTTFSLRASIPPPPLCRAYMSANQWKRSAIRPFGISLCAVLRGFGAIWNGSKQYIVISWFKKVYISIFCKYTSSVSHPQQIKQTLTHLIIGFVCWRVVHCFVLTLAFWLRTVKRAAYRTYLRSVGLCEKASAKVLKLETVLWG